MRELGVEYLRDPYRRFHNLSKCDEGNMPVFEEGYALAIGVAHYEKARSLPESVAQDAQDILALLRSPLHCGYSDAHTRLLLNEHATADNIRDGLRWLASSASPKATAIVFFSGHGGRVESGPLAGNYLIPYDCDPTNLGKTAIAGVELTGLLHGMEAQRLLIIFDCCYSGGTGDAKVSDELARMYFKSGFAESYYEQLARGSGRVIMASSRSNEISLVFAEMNNSLFTHFLLEALQGKARTRGDGLIRVFDVFDYVSEEVPAYGSKKGTAGGHQHPIFKAADLENNFPVALYQGGKRASTNLSTDQQRSTAVDKTALRKMMARAFSLQELSVLCADIEQELAKDGIQEDGSQLQVNLDMVGGDNLVSKILNLIDYLDRRDLLIYLVRTVRRHRPGFI